MAECMPKIFTKKCGSPFRKLPHFYYPYLQPFVVSSDGICAYHSRIYLLRSDLHRFIAQRIRRRCCQCCCLHESILVRILNAEVCKCRRQSHFHTEGNHLIQQVFIRIFQNELRQSTEGNLLAMIQVMALFNAGQTVVDRMCACQAAALKSDTGKKGIPRRGVPFLSIRAERF